MVQQSETMAVAYLLTEYPSMSCHLPSNFSPTAELGISADRQLQPATALCSLRVLSSDTPHAFLTWRCLVSWSDKDSALRHSIGDDHFGDGLVSHIFGLPQRLL